MRLRPFIAVCMTLPLMSANADIYKYTDENGVVNYTNLPNRLPGKAERIAREPQPGSAAVTAPSPGGRSTSARASEASPAGFPRVDGGTQRKRDESRRQILESELQTEQKALGEARQALLAGQEPPPAGDRNYPRFLERVKGLQDQVDTHQANLEALQKEIANLH